MRLLVVASRDVLDDARAVQQARLAQSMGWHAEILCWDRAGVRPARDEWQGIPVNRIHNSAVMARLPSDTWRNPLWWRAGSKWVRANPFDVVLCGDLDTLAIGAAAKRARGSRLIYDCCEMFHEMVRDKVARAVSSGALAMERRLIQRADHVLVVDQTYVPYVRDALGFAGPVTLVMNCMMDPPTAPYQPVPQGPVQIFYAGSLSPDRLILPIATLPERVPGVEVVMAGSGVLEPDVRALAGRVAGLTFLGRIPFTEIGARMQDAHATPAMTDPSNANVRLATSVKQFEAMAAGRPVIATEGTRTGDLAATTGTGLVAPFSTEGLDAAVLRLRDEPGLADQLGRRGHELARSTYNWAAEGGKLRKVLASLTVPQRAPESEDASSPNASTPPPSRILFFLANKHRDLPIWARLGAALESCGHAVEIVAPWDIAALRRFKPHLVVVHTTEDPTLRAMCLAARRRGAHVINLLSEGTISKYVEGSWGGEFAEDHPDHLTIAWGPRAREILLRYGRRPEQVVVTGNPRWDRYAEPFLPRAEFAQRFGLDAGRPIVLYATSLVPKEGIDPLDFKHLKNFESHTMPRLLRLRETVAQAMMDLAAARPEIQLVIKLHPFDEPTLYEERARQRDLANVKVLTSHEVGIGDAINACDLFLHWNSTSSTEAWFLGKPTLSVHLDPELDHFLTDFIQGSEVVRDASTLPARVGHYLGGGQLPPGTQAARAAYVADWYHKVDGHSLDRVVEAFNSYLGANLIVPRKGFAASELPWHLQVALRQALRLEPPTRLKVWRPRHTIYATRAEVASALQQARQDLAARTAAGSA